jgi:hypothetical protein
MTNETTGDQAPEATAPPPQIAPQVRAQLAFAAAHARRERGLVREPVTRDDTAEELSSKAAANRARVAFLARKGATMQDWIKHCEAEADRH